MRPAFRGRVSFRQGVGSSPLAWVFPNQADQSIFFIGGSANFLPEPLASPHPLRYPRLSCQSVKNQQNQQAGSAATKALHLVVSDLPTCPLKLGVASCKPSQSPCKLAVGFRSLGPQHPALPTCSSHILWAHLLCHSPGLHRAEAASRAIDASWLQESQLSRLTSFPAGLLQPRPHSPQDTVETQEWVRRESWQAQGGEGCKTPNRRRGKKIQISVNPLLTRDWRTNLQSSVKRLTAKWKRATKCKFKSPKTPKRHNYNYCWGKLFKTKNTFPLTIKISFHCFFFLELSVNNLWW